jgi:Zn finger protein HypA/HybF involved in hydrogenase expression
VIRTENAKVTCKDCGFEWFGETSAHALRTVGSCTKCRGELQFHDGAGLPATDPVAENVPAHLVLGNPRF